MKQDKVQPDRQKLYDWIYISLAHDRICLFFLHLSSARGAGYSWDVVGGWGDGHRNTSAGSDNFCCSCCCSCSLVV